jgi:hypothetical protein
LRAEGVNCATCHVRDGAILAPRRSGRAETRTRALPTRSTTRASPCRTPSASGAGPAPPGSPARAARAATCRGW